jgi:hypothetical protein
LKPGLQTWATPPAILFFCLFLRLGFTNFACIGFKVSIFLLLPPKWLELQTRSTMPDYRCGFLIEGWWWRQIRCPRGQGSYESGPAFPTQELLAVGKQ